MRLVNLVEEAERTAKGIEEPRNKRSKMTNQDYRNENNDDVWLRT